MQGADIAVHDMGVDLGGLHVGMAEEILEDADIDTVLQKMGGKTVAEGVAAYLLMDLGLEGCPFDGLLQTRLQDMVAHLLAGARVPGTFPGGKDPLPAGLSGCLGVFPGQGLGDKNFAETGFEILVMESLHLIDLREFWGHHP